MIRKIALKRTRDTVEASLPREMIERLGLGDHDKIAAVETDRGILLTGRDHDIEQTMTLFERVRKKFDRAFEELAK